MTPALRAELGRLLALHETRHVPAEETDHRAAVVLLLRDAAGSRADASGSRADAAGSRALDELEALFVRRAEVEGDPWSGHMALPGGRHSPPDEDLAVTALRELREETSLDPGRDALLGRLDEIHPRSRRLPSIAVTPFVGWTEPEVTVVENAELAGHVWVPVRTLRAPEHRSTLRLERRGAVRVFPTVEYEGRTIWGLTFRIVQEFLEVLDGGEGGASRGRADAGGPAPGAAGGGSRG
ncbi:MAG TPA: CoA pyrophosphatase [Gemmatimonadota bacterium]|nr:CoA pyrophosphatase [Gemmatimonadota bacterium]